MIIDTHSHLNFNAFKEDLDKVIKRTLAQDIWIINVGSKYETSKRAIEISNEYNIGVYSAVGLHPIYSASEFTKTKTDPEEGNFSVKEEYFDKERYRRLAESDKVVAIGEIGLDYYYRSKTNSKLAEFKEKQKQVLIQQLDLAEELNLPVILHCRMAHNDLIEILKTKLNIKGVIHCFTGNWEQAERYLEMGFYLGINGIIDKVDLNEVIKKTPLEKILVETDCPYLTPLEENGKRNEPIFIKHIIQKIAKIKNIDYSQIVEITTQNARNLFKI
ncbi:MAG: TatD family hydrolase [Candidatus Nealsonbacteria bacterium]